MRRALTGGGVNFAGVKFPSADATVDMFAEKFGCPAPRPAAETRTFALPSESDPEVGRCRFTPGWKQLTPRLLSGTFSA